MNLRDAGRLLVVRERALAAARKASWLPPLLIRLCLAAVFIPSGWGKLHDLQKVTEFFAELGIPVAAPERRGGRRQRARVRRAPAGRSGVAPGRAAPDRQHDDRDCLTAKRADIGGPVNLFTSTLIYGVLAIAIVVLGAGAVSADGLATRLLFHPNEHQQQKEIDA